MNYGTMLLELTLNSPTSPIDHNLAFLNGIRFHSPWILFIIFTIAFVASTIISSEPSTSSDQHVHLGPGGKPLPPSAKKKKQERERRKKLLDFSPTRKIIFRCLSIGLIATFLANGINIILHALSKQDGWWCGKATGIYVCASAFLYNVFLISLFDSSPSPNIAHQITWVVAAIIELVLFSTSFSLYNPLPKNRISIHTETQAVVNQSIDWELIDLVIGGVRVLILMFLIVFYTLFSLERMVKGKNNNGSDSDEYAPLLGNGSVNGAISHNGLNDNGSDYASQLGNSDSTANCKHDEEDEPAFYKPTKIPERTWWEYIKGYSIFFPYLWPSKSIRLQMIVVICFMLIICQRAVNIVVPLQIGKVTDQLAKKNENVLLDMPWLSISLLVLFKLLQGSSGILGATRSALWIPISQYSYKALTSASFEHVHGLSLDFHLSKRTGEILSALSKGNAINNFLEQITFQVLPMIFDLCVAIVYFGVAFDAYYALIVTIITFSYLYLTVRMARWRSDQRRQMTNLSREEAAVKNDSLMSYETVKYFNAEVYEFNRYRQAITAFQKMEYKVNISLSILNISQNMVFMTGLLMTSIISAYQVTTNARKVGDFVTLLTYMSQLQQPLNFFGSFYRSVQSAMISGERLLELFKENPTVYDEPSARNLQVCEGHIRFENIDFRYDKRKVALEGLSFTCPAGTTTALVGESGGGKSTVFRLLFRFYNAHGGDIELDGYNVKDITIESLRRHIGVVPQDTILFNETLMYNLKYANQNATDEEVFAACRAASIHDKIMGFPDGYNTKVGERGLRLSGGEKQRVAIARCILKNPRIILLDEATAALDSETEQNIQDSLTMLSEGRTMLVIAHRLSTITCADQILVIHEGKVAEGGTHNELLALKGRYYSMWKKQIRAERALEHASDSYAKKKAMKAEADRHTYSSGNEASPSEDTSENEGIGTRADASFILPDDDDNKVLVPQTTHLSEPTSLNSESDFYGDFKAKTDNDRHENVQEKETDYVDDESSTQT